MTWHVAEGPGELGGQATYQLGNLLVAVERSLQRLIGDVRKNAEWLTKEVAELERETNPVLAAAHPTGNKPGRSILKVGPRVLRWF
ncbi:hypothetical protein PLESTB_001703800 [Pleodorina starrii]|uniref:Uncharacterized protein n=1 Tax=Pleodorina starrii TaxID=330485 RepID=A0A9W6BZE4_9CHLO|nr:hypothetical protein PLESTB_001703800 [Pleodorina starrii]